MSWNYRIVRYASGNGYGLHEVYYYQNDEPCGKPNTYYTDPTTITPSITVWQPSRPGSANAILCGKCSLKITVETIRKMWHREVFKKYNPESEPLINLIFNLLEAGERNNREHAEQISKILAGCYRMFSATKERGKNGSDK